MTFKKQNLQFLGVGTKASKVPSSYSYWNEDGDVVTASGFFALDCFTVGDQIAVVSADYKSKTDFRVSAVSSGVATVVKSVGKTLAVDADGTTLSISYDTITFDTTDEAFSYALPDGVVGQKMRLIMIVDGGNNAVITPANLGNGSTLTFADVGDACDLEFQGTDWWVVGNTGVAIA